MKGNAHGSSAITTPEEHILIKRIFHENFFEKKEDESMQIGEYF